ncbi:MAG: hypothetical protein Q7R96_04800 [Nanoarchaeota archaeon]|nr:hypothetical protein [Nanoarchaeota archaeon]
MAETYMFNGGNIARRLFSLAFMAAVGTVVVRCGYDKIKPGISQSEQEYAVRQVSESLDRYDFEVASKMQESFLARQQLSPENVIVLNIARERAEKRLPFKQALDSALKTDDRADDSAALAAVRTSGLFSDREVSQLSGDVDSVYKTLLEKHWAAAEKTFTLKDNYEVLEEMKASSLFYDCAAKENALKTLSEDALFLQVDTTTGNDRIAAAEKYLTWYPEGAHRREAVAYLLTDKFAVWENSLVTHRSFHELSAEVKSSISLLERFVDNPISINGLVDIETLQSKLQESVAGVAIHQDVTVNTVKKGDKVVNVNANKVNWDASYLADREKAVALWTSLVVFDTSVENYKGVINVELPSLPEGKEYAWSKDWDCLKRKVIRYFPDELKIIFPVDVLKQQRLEEDVKKFKGLLERFK